MPTRTIAKGTGAGVQTFVQSTLEPWFENILYFGAMLVVIIGAIDTIMLYFREEGKKQTDDIIADMRIQFSEAIALSLTFVLAAEVVKTIRVPTMQQVVRISIIVLLRQFIAYFLDKDIERLRRSREERSKHAGSV